MDSISFVQNNEAWTIRNRYFKELLKIQRIFASLRFWVSCEAVRTFGTDTGAKKGKVRLFFQQGEAETWRRPVRSGCLETAFENSRIKAGGAHKMARLASSAHWWAAAQPQGIGFFSLTKLGAFFTFSKLILLANVGTCWSVTFPWHQDMSVELGY